MTWATVTDVANITGKTVTMSTVSMAAATIELVTGAIESVERADTSRRDAYWLRQAVVFQAAWLASTPDFLERLNATQIGQDGQSMTLAADGLILAPLARQAVRRLSWKGTRTLKPRSADHMASLGSVLVNDEGQNWRPL